MTTDETSSTASTTEQHLSDLADLLTTGPVELGAYTQAEMSVVLGGAPALAGQDAAVLAEAVRSLAARGVLHHVPGGHTAELVGDIGLLVALTEHSIGTLEIRRGHPAPANTDWRWLVSVFGNDVVGVDRVDPLGLHRLSLYSAGKISEGIAHALIDGRAKVHDPQAAPVAISDEDVRALAEGAERRWQLIHRVPRADGTQLAVDALVVRVSDDRVDLITGVPGETGYQRMPLDEDRLRDFVRGLFALHQQV